MAGTGQEKTDGSFVFLQTVVVLGSLWGLSEVVISDTLKLLQIPFRAGILTGIGMGIMGMAVGMHRRPVMLAGLALVAIAAKQLVVPLLDCSIMCKANSCAAVLLQGCILCGLVSFFERFEKGDLSSRVVTGISAALIAAGAFYAVGTRLAPCQHLLSFAQHGGMVSFIYTEGFSWAFFSGILYPAGYRAGVKLNNPVRRFRNKEPRAYYATLTVIVAGCWAAAASIIALGS